MCSSCQHRRVSIAGKFGRSGVVGDGWSGGVSRQKWRSIAAMSALLVGKRTLFRRSFAGVVSIGLFLKLLFFYSDILKSSFGYEMW
jgi:hypothetical protein